jgi:hypothetical protein
VTLRDVGVELIDRLRAEATMREDDRASDAPTDDLEAAVARIAAWLADGNPEHLSGIGRMVTDRWALTSELGAALIELENRVRDSGLL